MALLTRVMSPGLAAASLVLLPSLAFADVGPKCGCTTDSAGASVGALVLAGATLVAVLRRRRDR